MQNDGLNLGQRFWGRLRRFLSWLIGREEEREDIRSLVDAGVRGMRAEVRTGIDDYEQIGADMDEIQDMLDEVNDAIEDQNDLLQDHLAEAQRAQQRKDEFAEEQANLEAESVAANLADLMDLRDELDQDVTENFGSLQDMKRINADLHRDTMSAEIRGKGAIITEKVAKAKKRITARKESYLGLGNRQKGRDLIEQAVQRAEREDSEATHRSEMVNTLLAQSGKRASQSKRLRGRAKELLEQSMQETGYTATQEEEAEDTSEASAS